MMHTCTVTLDERQNDGVNFTHYKAASIKRKVIFGEEKDTRDSFEQMIIDDNTVEDLKSSKGWRKLRKVDYALSGIEKDLNKMCTKFDESNICVCFAMDKVNRRRWMAQQKNRSTDNWTGLSLIIGIPSERWVTVCVTVLEAAKAQGQWSGVPDPTIYHTCSK